MLTGNARSPQAEPVRTRIPDGLKFSPFSSRKKIPSEAINPKLGKSKNENTLRYSASGWEESYVVEKHVAITQSAVHSYHLSINNVKKHTLWRPCPSKTFAKLDSTIPDAAVPDTLARGFREAPTMITAANRQLHDRILFYMSNAMAVEDYEKKSNGIFITLVGILLAEENAADAETGTWANNEKQKLIKAGLATASIVCFDSFHLQFRSTPSMPCARSDATTPTLYVFNYSVAAISWASKKQATIALSSCEAEIVALSEAAKEGVYLRRFLADLGFGSEPPTAVATDNTGAKALSYNPEHHERVKHVERRHFYVRELVEDGLLTVPYVATTSNMADFFTKPLAAAQFYSLRNRIMNFERPVPDESSRGHARMVRRDRRRQRAGGCRDAGLVARLGDILDPTVRSGPDVRADTDVVAAASEAACVSGGASHATLMSDSSSVPRDSPRVAAAVLRTDVRSRPSAS